MDVKPFKVEAVFVGDGDAGAAVIIVIVVVEGADIVFTDNEDAFVCDDAVGNDDKLDLVLEVPKLVVSILGFELGNALERGRELLYIDNLEEPPH
jgi:hypothetical protein